MGEASASRCPLPTLDAQAAGPCWSCHPHGSQQHFLPWSEDSRTQRHSGFQHGDSKELLVTVSRHLPAVLPEPAYSAPLPSRGSQEQMLKAKPVEPEVTCVNLPGQGLSPKATWLTCAWVGSETAAGPRDAFFHVLRWGGGAPFMSLEAWL